MKKLFTLLAPVLFIPYGLCVNETMENPNISLNPQDVPIFYDSNPLTGMKSFTVITSFPSKDIETRKRIQQSIEKPLKVAGEVIHLKDNDMQGFGTGNLLLIQMGNVLGWDGSEMPISRISLSVETATTLDKTGTKTFPMIWSINTFLQRGVDSNFENNLTKAVQKLINDFVRSYQYANKDQSIKPIFYIYD